MRTPTCTLIGIVMAVTTALVGTAPPAHATPVACQREISKGFAKFTQARLKALGRCEDAVVAGKLAGPCPDGKTAAVLAKAEAKLRSSIANKCGGADHVCGSGSDESLASIGWGSGACRNFESGGCTNPIADCDDVAQCLVCVGTAAIDQAIGLYYGALHPTTDAAIDRCQREIGRSAAKAFRAETKALQKCADARLKGSGASCPDPKASSLISRARAKAVAKICRACGGADGVCGGSGDLTPAAIGFPATCPSVTVPGGTACGGAVNDLQGLVNCVTCVTAFKADCTDAISVPGLEAYPANCNANPNATPTGGVNPTPAPTSTPSLCGNGQLDGTEECDGANAPTCPGECRSNCKCPEPCTLPAQIPEIMNLQILPGLDSDNGWTGIANDVPYGNYTPFSAGRLANCDWNLDSPTCGQCDVVGTAQYRGAVKNCYCSNLADRDASSHVVCDPEAATCGGGETCECYNGAILPVSSGGAPGCIVNRFTQPVSGTINVALSGPHAGESDLGIRVESAVHTGIGLSRPCPVCVGDPVVADGVRGGTCNAGPREGMSCDVAGTHDVFGTVTFDCPPDFSLNIGNLDIKVPHETTGTNTLTRGTRCTAENADCWCSTCATAAGEPCNSNADCPSGVICGGRRCIGGPNNGNPCTNASECPDALCNRPGEPTKRNSCTDGVCTLNPSDPQGADEGICEGGPIDRLCSIETFRSCGSNAECNPPPSGTCSDCVGGQICQATLRQCFMDPIVRTGIPGVQTAIAAGAYCMTPVASASINKVSGWPGPGTVRVPLRRFFGPASCGNGTLDANEQCDTGHDGACPGECQPDCRCPAAATCGDGQVNQPSEVCDGIDDDACPGGCQSNCTCGATACGNGTAEPGEQCDGADDASCPGACQGDCTCGPFCGDGTVDAGEQCDGAGSTACPPAACQSDCTCGPFCGNNQIDPGEACDGNGTGSCPGTCQSDCTCSAVCGDDHREAGELCDGTDDALCPGKCSNVCTCPGLGEVTFSTKAGSDLDAGWSGVANNFQLPTGGVLRGELSGCDGQSDKSCSLFANVGSFCANDPTRSCTKDAECSGGTCTISYYGPPIAASAGGVPACVLLRFASDGVGDYDLATGAASVSLTFNALAFLGVSVSQPCPICDCGKADLSQCQIGESGTCAGSGVIGNPPCTVQGNGPGGPTSLQCPPSSSLNVSGDGLVLPATLTTNFISTPSSQPCDGAGHTGEGCFCDGQPQPNACLNACDGGTNDGAGCDSDGDCPGAGAGACKPLCRQIVGLPLGEAQCAAGPVDRTCAGAPEISCTNDGGCPTGKGPCAAHNRRCFLDPIERQGIASTTDNSLVATFCVAETGSSTINTVAGLPGPGSLSLPTSVDARLCGDGVVNRFQEECDRTDDDNCPGTCLPNCLCQRTCGNNTIEFGEQCDGTADTACPGQCEPASSENACKCPPVCGDGFIGEGEQCDPGGLGGTPPADDDLCPGLCNGTTCQCTVQVPTCLNNKLDPGEVCDEPAIGCGPLQVCAGCLACLPPPDVLPPISGVCGDLNITPGEVCELPAQGCPEGQLCNQCTSCVPFIPFCGNLNIEAGEACELPALGCGPLQICALCQQCVDLPVAICGNRSIEPGEVCELPQIGCGLLQGCLACQACVP
jgi:hypothetical protein